MSKEEDVVSSDSILGVVQNFGKALPKIESVLSKSVDATLTIAQNLSDLSNLQGLNPSPRGLFPYRKSLLEENGSTGDYFTIVNNTEYDARHVEVKILHPKSREETWRFSDSPLIIDKICPHGSSYDFRILNSINEPTNAVISISWIDINDLQHHSEIEI